MMEHAFRMSWTDTSILHRQANHCPRFLGNLARLTPLAYRAGKRKGEHLTNPAAPT